MTIHFTLHKDKINLKAIDFELIMPKQHPFVISFCDYCNRDVITIYLSNIIM